MSRPDFSRFMRHGELLATLQLWADVAPELVSLISIGHSHEGRAITVATITDRSTGDARDKPALWVDGNIHATELVASTACLYFIDWLLQHRDDAEVRRALRTRTFYVCPRISPDGAEWALADRPRLVRSNTRRYPHDEEPLSGLVVEDIDGNGRIRQMRVPDANGPWKRHPQDARLLVRREPTETGGEYFRVMPEGRLVAFDGVNIELAGLAGNAQGLDLNRNFPARWRQEFEQDGAGPYPASEPEIRAVVDFLVAHPNIGAGTSFHTYSGVLLRPFGDRPDDAMPPEDLWTYRTVGRKGEELTGYPAISEFHDYAYSPGHAIGGTFDWIYEHLGCLAWTVEIWNPRREAGIENRAWIDWFRDHPIEDDLRMLQWSDHELRGEGHAEWTPFDHPELGAVEIGGWDRLHAFTNPPPHRRESEVARFPGWLLWQALVLPQLELRSAVASAVGDGIWRVRLVVQNAGWLPTYVTKMALQRKQSRGVHAEITLPPGARLLGGTPRIALGELEGWAYRHTGISFWPDRKPTDSVAMAEWTVRSPGGARIALTAWHPRAGRIRCEVDLI